MYFELKDLENILIALQDRGGTRDKGHVRRLGRERRRLAHGWGCHPQMVPWWCQSS